MAACLASSRSASLRFVFSTLPISVLGGMSPCSHCQILTVAVPRRSFLQGENMARIAGLPTRNLGAVTKNPSLWKNCTRSSPAQILGQRKASQTMAVEGGESMMNSNVVEEGPSEASRDGIRANGVEKTTTQLRKKAEAMNFLSDSTLNTFSNPPPSMSNNFRKTFLETPRITLQNENENSPGSGSIGSRSKPSAPSIPARFSKYTKPNQKKFISSPTGKAKTSYPRTSGEDVTRQLSDDDEASTPETFIAGYEGTNSTPSIFENSTSPFPPSHSSSESSRVPQESSRSSTVKMPDWMQTFQFSYSEAPKAPVIGFRETPWSPFGPADMVKRPWTGRPPLEPSKKKVHEFDSFNPPPRKKGIKFVQNPGPFLPGQGPKPGKTREEILGEPLTAAEIKELVEGCQRGNRQVNLGRDGLTHNMLEVIHTHWKRCVCCKIKCKGVPTVDMDNVAQKLEEKTGGVVIERAGGVVYLFRGRNYNYKTRPKLPIMLWKPPAPIYPKLIQYAPEGLTPEEARLLRGKGRRVEPICKLSKNGVYLSLVNDVRQQFLVDEVVRVNCTGMNISDYKKIGAKLKELVPCVLLSFEKEHIMVWRGWPKPNDVSKSSEDGGGSLEMVSEGAGDGLHEIENVSSQLETSSCQELIQEDDGFHDQDIPVLSENSGVTCGKETLSTSPLLEVDLLWQKAIDEGSALQLDGRTDVDSILEKVTQLAEGEEQIAQPISKPQITRQVTTIDPKPTTQDGLRLNELGKLLDP